MYVPELFIGDMRVKPVEQIVQNNLRPFLVDVAKHLPEKKLLLLIN